MTIRTSGMGIRKRWAIMIFVNALAAFGATAFSELAWANGSATGVITSLYYNQQLGDYVFITISGTKNGIPFCETDGTYQFVLNMSPSTNANATAMYAALLSARVTQTPVSLVGDGNCPAFGSENVIVVTF